MRKPAQKKRTTRKRTKFDKLLAPGLHRNPVQFSSVLLAEFTCTGCLNSKYIPTMLLTEVPEPVYPADLEHVEQLLLKSVKFEVKHTAPIFSSPTHEHPEGYAHCGFFKLSRLWLPWENPNRYQEVFGELLKPGLKQAVRGTAGGE